jgi:hypothetical protein
MMVVSDPIELYVAQNLALDGLMYPLVYRRHRHRELVVKGGPTVSMLLQFHDRLVHRDQKWIDATVKTMTGESPANAASSSPDGSRRGWHAPPRRSSRSPRSPSPTPPRDGRRRPLRTSPRAPASASPRTSAL